MQQLGSKYFAHRPSPTLLDLEGEIKRKKIIFSRIWSSLSNLMESRMQQHGSKYFALQTHPHPRLLWWGQKVKIQFFQNMVTLHIKLTESRMQQYGSKYFFRRPPPQAMWVGSKGQNLKISEHGHAAYQINRQETLTFKVKIIHLEIILAPKHRVV